MSRKRPSEDGCATAHALDLVGERWALLVVRELLMGPRRFTDLEAGLPGASTNALSQRLRELEAADVVRRRRLIPGAEWWVYELTEWGRKLETVVMELGRWGAVSPRLPQREHASLASLMLAVKALFDTEAAGDLDAEITLRIDDDSFLLRLQGGGIDISRGESSHPDAVITTTKSAFEAAVCQSGGLDDFGIDGDRDLVARLLTLFPAPQPAP